MNLSYNAWLLILIVFSIVFLCFFAGIIICSRTHCCSCFSTKHKYTRDSPTHVHQRQYSPINNAALSLIKPNDLWAGADCLSPPTATIRNSGTAERHYETSSTAGSGTLQRCNHHHRHHHLYHHTQETQPLTHNIELNNDQHRHSYVPSNDGSSSIDGNTNGLTRFNTSIRTRPIAISAPFEQQMPKKSMKNLRKCSLIDLNNMLFHFSYGYCIYNESYKCTATACHCSTHSTESSICCSTE